MTFEAEEVELAAAYEHDVLVATLRKTSALRIYVVKTQSLLIREHALALLLRQLADLRGCDCHLGDDGQTRARACDGRRLYTGPREGQHVRSVHQNLISKSINHVRNIPSTSECEGEDIN